MHKDSLIYRTLGIPRFQSGGTALAWACSRRCRVGVAERAGDRIAQSIRIQSDFPHRDLALRSTGRTGGATERQTQEPPRQTSAAFSLLLDLLRLPVIIILASDQPGTYIGIMKAKSARKRKPSRRSTARRLYPIRAKRMGYEMSEPK